MWRDAMIDPESGGLTGYLRVPIPDGREALLFLYNGVPFRSGSIESGRFIARNLEDFKGFWPHATSVEFCVTDPALFQCIASLFWKRPSAELPAAQVTAQLLGQAVQRSPGESALVIYADDALSFLYCQNGVPISIYPAPGHDFPLERSALEQLAGYIAGERQHKPVRVYFFPDVIVGADPGAGAGLMTYFGLAEGSLQLEVEENPAFIVKLLGRTVFQFPLSKGRVVVGRGLEADLILDNLSVSRVHAIVEREGNRVTITDNNSANGVTHNGNAVRTADLKPGDTVGIGKYELTYTTRGTDAAIQSAPQAPSSSALQGTVMVGQQSAAPAQIEYQGQRHKLTGMFFVVGSAGGVTLQVPDPQLDPTQFVIQRRPDGYYLHVEGTSHPVTINGSPVQEAQLRHGDAIAVGNHTFRFVAS